MWSDPESCAYVPSPPTRIASSSPESLTSTWSNSRFGPQNLRIPRFEKPVYVVAGGLTGYRKSYREKNTCELCTAALRDWAVV